MMCNEAWLLVFVFATIKSISEGGFTELAVATTADGALRPMGEIVELFSGARCSAYTEKPKIVFFLDASRLTFDNPRVRKYVN